MLAVLFGIDTISPTETQTGDATTLSADTVLILSANDAASATVKQMTTRIDAFAAIDPASWTRHPRPGIAPFAASEEQESQSSDRTRQHVRTGA